MKNKKKERERKAKEKVLRRRKAIRAAAKKEYEDRLNEIKAQKMANRASGRTIINRSPEEQHAILQHNMEILKALDAQQLDAQQLEASQQTPVQRKMKAAADVAFIPNPETNEPLKPNN